MMNVKIEVTILSAMLGGVLYILGFPPHRGGSAVFEVVKAYLINIFKAKIDFISLQFHIIYALNSIL